VTKLKDKQTEHHRISNHSRRKKKKEEERKIETTGQNTMA